MTNSPYKKIKDTILHSHKGVKGLNSQHNYIWAVIETGSTVFMQFLSLVILSRILNPSDYGVLGTMAIFIAVGDLLVDSGLGGALIKKNKPTRTDYSTLFVFNVSISIIVYLLIFLISKNYGAFYGNIELVKYLRVYGLFIVIASLGIVQLVRLTRELRFRDMALVTIVSNVVSFLVALILAKCDYGVWSLIFQQLTFIICRVLLFMFINRFIPNINFSWNSFKEQFNFGGSILGSNLLHVIYGNIVSNIIPKISTISENGLYLQASKIQGVPVNIMTTISDKVLFPVLSKIHDEDIWLKKSRKILSRLSFCMYLVLTICILFSQVLVYLLLGEQWQPASKYLSILLYAGYGTVIVCIIRNLIKSSGKTYALLKIESSKSVVGIILIVLVYRFGIMALLYSIVLTNLFAACYSVYCLSKISSYSTLAQLKDIGFALIMPISTLVYLFLL